ARAVDRLPPVGGQDDVEALELEELLVQLAGVAEVVRHQDHGAGARGLPARRGGHGLHYGERSTRGATAAGGGVEGVAWAGAGRPAGLAWRARVAGRRPGAGERCRARRAGGRTCRAFTTGRGRPTGPGSGRGRGCPPGRARGRPTARTRESPR